MSVDSRLNCLSNIRFLIKSLQKKNFKVHSEQLFEFVEIFGLEADRYLLRCLLSNIDFSETTTKIAPPSVHVQLFQNICDVLINKPTFISLICDSFEHLLSVQSTLKHDSNLLHQISKVLKLTTVQEVAVTSALRFSLNSDLELLAKSHLKTIVPILIEAYIESSGRSDQQDGGLHETTPETLHFILADLLSTPKEFGLSTELYVSFTRTLQKDFSRDFVPIVISPFIYQIDLEFEHVMNISSSTNNSTNIPTVNDSDKNMADESINNNMNDNNNSNTNINNNSINITDNNIVTGVKLQESLTSVIFDFGYDLTSCADKFRCNFSALSNLNGSENIKEEFVAAVLIAMFRYDESDLSDDESDKFWDFELFIESMKEFNNSLRWKGIICELDSADFQIIEYKSLKSFITLLTLLHKSNQISFKLLFRFWINFDNQFRLLQTILKYPELVPLSILTDCLINVDGVVSQANLNSPENMLWRMSIFVKCLLNISERAFLNEIKEIFKQPLQTIPEVLILVLIPLYSTGGNILIRDLMLSLIAYFASTNNCNSSLIFHAIWNYSCNDLKMTFVRCLSELYIKNQFDSTTLSKILDIAHDLKAFNAFVTNRLPLPFIIDFACLASRREYLNLEVFLNEKIRDYGDQFIKALAECLSRRSSVSQKIDDNSVLSKSSPLPQETVNIILSCIQSSLTTTTTTSLSENEDNLKYRSPLMMMPSNSNTSNVTNAVNIAAMFRNQRMHLQQPPPQQSIDTVSFNQSLTASPLFKTASVTTAAAAAAAAAVASLDPINTLSNLTLNKFNMSTAPLGQLMSSSPSSSPSRIMGSNNIPGTSTSNTNTFQSMMSLQQQQQQQHQVTAAIGTSTQPLVPNLGSVSNFNRMSNNNLILDKISMNQITVDNRAIYPDMNIEFSKEAEEEANTYFQRIYNHAARPGMSVDEILEVLKGFRDSKVDHELEILNCMVKNLFDEFQFFPQYPDEELHTTAQLFGGLIEYNILPDYITTGLALRFVLEALKKSPNTKMYYFGLAALERFKTRLKDYVQYCENIRIIAHYNEFPPHLIDYVESGLQGLDPPAHRVSNQVQNLVPMFKTNVTNSVSATTSAHSTPSKTIAAIAATPRPSIANATNIDTLLIATDKTDKIKEPPDPIQEKIAFIFNNLSQLNMQTKCEEIKEVLLKEYWPWFAQYLVMKRVTIELNFQTLYINFMDAIRIPEINKLVIEETFRNIKVLLRSDKIMSNFSDRSLLKNLGHWLGMLTLARNKPILFTDIDFKSLLLEAYHLGQEELLFIVPFIAKVLEAVVRSKVFKPPNPWTMAILNMLGELHAEPKTKLNLKFEVEVLCKSLKVDLKSLEPTNVLNDPEILKNITYQLHQHKKSNIVPIYNDESCLNPMPSLVPTTIQQQPPPPPSLPPQSQQQQQQQQPQRESPTPISPIPPRYSYFDNTISMNNIFNSIMINGSLILIQSNPTLKDLVKKAFEQAAQECLASVCDRLTKIVIMTTEQTVCRDFALDPDENHLRIAAHHMVRHLASGYVMISCREQILIVTQRNLKDVLINALNLQTDDKDLKIIEATVNTLIQENVETMSAIIQKTSIERAIHDIDKRLMNEYKERIKAKNEGRNFQYNQFIYNYHRDRIPEMLRMKPGSVTQQQLTVYNEFARNIPGFTPITTDREISLLLPKTPPLIGLLDFNNSTNLINNNIHSMNMIGNNGNNMLNNTLQVTEEFLNVIEKLAMECEQFLQLYANLSTTNNTYIILVNRLKETLFKAKTLQGNYLSIDLITTTVESFQKGMQFVLNDMEICSVRFRELHIRTLKALQDSRGLGTQWVNKIVTRTLIDSNNDELRFCVQAIDILIRTQLVHIPTYDLHLSQCMENGTNLSVVNFSIQLLKSLLIDNRAHNVSESDFFNVLETLNRLLNNGRLPIPDGLSNLMETIYNGRDNSTISYEKSTNSVAHIHSGIVQMRSGEFSDVPCDMYEKTDILIHEWIAMYHNNLPNRDSSRIFQHFIQQMSMAGVLKTDDLITTFFSIATRMCIEIVYRTVQDPNMNEFDLRGRSFHTIDPFVRLIVLLVKHSGDNSNSNTKLNLFNKIVGLITGAVLQDHEVRGIDFHQLSYHRILILLFIEMNSNEPVLENINFQVINTYCHVLHILRPAIVSGFTYAWLEIISHRLFIGRLLHITPQQKGWAFYAQLLIDLFKFLAPFLRSAHKSKAILSLYNGTLKLLLVLLHDFPEFLVDYQYGFCDVIPPNCIQLRNLILSAFPRNMRLADPFVVNLRVDQLPEVAIPPRILTNYVSNIKSEKLKHDIDLYLQKRTPVTFLSELRTYLQTDCEPGNRYNIPLMNALVLYVGVQAIACIRSRNLQISAQTIACSAHMDIYQNLLVDLDNEGRYIFLNAIANHLRFPNSHTHYFSCVILKLFVEANSPKVQEQITRILLERLVVNRPHPWGLLITFIDLIKNPIYKFWSHEFVSCAPEITNLLESVARSCQVQKQIVQNSDAIQ